AQDDLRQLDERSVSRVGAGQLYRCRRAGDAARQLAYLSGPDQALRPLTGAALEEAPLRRARASHLVGGERREPEAGSPADRAPARSACGAAFPLRRAAPGEPGRG